MLTTILSFSIACPYLVLVCLGEGVCARCRIHVCTIFFSVRFSCSQAGPPLCVSEVCLGLLTHLPPLLDAGLTAAHTWLPHSPLKCLSESFVSSYSFLCVRLVGYNFPAALTFLLLVFTLGIFFFFKKTLRIF